MRYWLEADMRPVELAITAARALDIEVINEPTRGGTDGSRLTEMGLPTPNLFTGMQNFHGPREWVSLHDLEKATELCVALVGLWAGELRSRGAEGRRSGGAEGQRSRGAREEPPKHLTLDTSTPDTSTPDT